MSSKITLINGDCLEKLKELPDNSVDSVVTDPPYELGFMGKSWDNTGIANNPLMWAECLRVLKPGGHLLAFSGTRTYHRMAVAIEDAGFEVRDMIEWVYGSGFPKSLNIGKAVDKIAPRLGQFDEFAGHLSEQIKTRGKTQKEIASLFPSRTGGLTGCVWNWANGANVPTVAQWNILKPLLGLSDDFLPLIERIEREREVVGKNKNCGTEKSNGDSMFGIGAVGKEVNITKGTSEWEGWGTALKPAHEPICMARKPLAEKTVAENVLKYGTGGINIDESRVGTEEMKFTKASSLGNNLNMEGGKAQEDYIGEDKIGRFPANLIHDNSEEVIECFPNESERFFKSIIYQAKSSKSERNKGLDCYLTVKYNGVITDNNKALCKDENMVAVQLLQKVISEQELVSFNIDESGVNIMGQCHQDSLSTILTETKRIIELKIYNLLMLSLINESTQVANSEMEVGGNLAESVADLKRWLLTTTKGNQELALGASRVVCRMLSLISEEENWKQKTNIHSTVKPIALMEYLIKMVTPKGGTVLDPFMGSGSTGVACKQNGYSFIGIDMTDEYIEIAKARISSIQEPML